MKPRKLCLFPLVALVAAFPVSWQLMAQGQKAEKAEKEEPHRYKLIEIGTLGGPSSECYFGDAQSLNDRGAVVGLADTSVSDPNFPNLNPYLLFDPFVHHAFRWKNGALTDLGALPGTNNSELGWISDRGLAAGASTNSSIDPLTGWPAEIAVFWSHDEIISLGTLGGNESGATAINDRGQIAGFAANTVPDSFPSPLGFGLPGFGTQQRAFLWEEGVMRDLGTLGGPDAVALLLNERGEIAGMSYTSSTPNASGSPTVDPFFWEHGKMLDLGGFGGTFGSANWLNNRGQVVGFSFLAGDSAVHPFLWSEDGGLIDLGTFGGGFGIANWVNDAGEVVGVASNQSEVQFAFRWKDGVMTNLGTQDGDPCSTAINVNSSGQIVGTSNNCQGESGHAFLWQNGHMIDLNAFVPAGSDLTLALAIFINDRGEILGTGVLPNGDFRAVLLVPCDEEKTDADGCKSENDGAHNALPRSSLPSRVPTPTTSAQPNLTPSDMKDRVRAFLTNRDHRFRGLQPE